MFTGLGDLSGGIFESFAHSVSGDGLTVVGDSKSALGTEAFRWTAVDGMQPLGDLSGGIFRSIARDILADGSVIVGLGTPVSGIREAFRWTAGGGMQGLGAPSGGGLGSEADAVSADGATVVGQGFLSSGEGQAFRWTAGGGMQMLGVLPGGDVDQSFAHGVSGDGSVVAGRSTSAAMPEMPFTEAYRWTAAGGMQAMGDLPGGGDLSELCHRCFDQRVSHRGAGRWTGAH